jgi:hypothetical protein
VLVFDESKCARGPACGSLPQRGLVGRERFASHVGFAEQAMRLGELAALGERLGHGSRRRIGPGERKRRAFGPVVCQMLTKARLKAWSAITGWRFESSLAHE